MSGVVLLLGPSGAGKSMQARILAAERNWVHVSSGDLLRQSSDTDLQAILASGQLAPSQAVQQLVQDAVEEVPLDRTIVIDGFPRLTNEAEWFDALLKQLNRPLLHVFNLEIDSAESQHRVVSRKRADDSSHALEQKWNEYRQSTQPVLDRYSRAGYLIKIDGGGSFEEVAARIAQVLD
jgi:adenylate kinase